MATGPAQTEERNAVSKSSPKPASAANRHLAKALFRFRAIMSLFIVGLVLSGVTAFPLLWELRILSNLLGVGAATGPEGYTGLQFWILTVRHGLEATYAAYPWIAYGTDWLAFAHLVIAGFFIGPLFHPLTSRPVIYTGIAACLGVIPLALICGPIRGIPLYWRFVDCSFGILGILPLLYCLHLLRQIEATSGVEAHRGRAI
jgi:hypothetical protein